MSEKFIAIISFVLLLFCAFLAVKIVNFFQRLIMKITDSPVMFYSLRTKIVWYVIVWLLVAGVICMPLAVLLENM